MADLSGRSVGRYHIIESLGQGGMAVVYKAFDTRLEREVAIKFIRTEQVGPAQLAGVLKRFEREAKALGRLNHPNIVGVHDFGEYNGEPYLVMVYVPGGTLKAKIGGKPMPYTEAARLLLPVAGALAYAHSLNIIHRDVKPANILLTVSSEPMLSDFGVAKILQAEDMALTGTGVGIGTPEYMAPEQWMGKAGPPADIYALGVVFYELVTGKKPYTADTPAAILIKQMTAPLPAPRGHVPGLPAAVERVLYKALAKDPDERYPTMAEFAAALEKLLNSSTWADEEETMTRVGEVPTLTSAFPMKGKGERPFIPSDVSPGDSRRDAQNPRPGTVKPGLKWFLIAGGILFGCLLLFSGTWLVGKLFTPTAAPTQAAVVRKTNTPRSRTNTAVSASQISPQTLITPTAAVSINTPVIKETPVPSFLVPTETETLIPTETETVMPSATETPLPSDTPEPTETPTPQDPVLVLDKAYFCRDGPDTSYRDRWDFPAGTRLPLIGKSTNGWWLVRLDIPEKTRAKQCWIHGGYVEGDASAVPYAPEVYTSEYNNNPN